MRSFLRALAASVAVVLSVVGCGGSGGGGGGGGGGSTPGSGSISVVSTTPTALVGCAPTPITINGTGFNSIGGTTFRVAFHAQGGATPFAGGSSDTATATGIVTSATTMTVVVPPVVICDGPSPLTITFDVLLESGVAASGSGAVSFTVAGPALASISTPAVPAAIATPFVLNGTGFGPVGGAVTIRLTADGGATIFKDGTKPFADVQGIVSSTTTITGVTPIATVCGAATAGCSVKLFFPDGCCTPTTANGFLTFVAPTLAGFSTTSLRAAVSDPAFVVSGTGFGADGTVAQVRFVADGGLAIFQDGTAPTVTVPGTVSGGGTAVTCASPLAAVCGVASRTASVHVVTAYGSTCASSATGALTFTAPAITGAAVGSPAPGSVPTQLDVTGADFGPVGAPTTVRFVADGGALMFQDGTAATIDVPAVVFSATVVRCTTPLVTVCGAANRTAGLRVFSPYGGACVDTGAAYVQFDGPTLAVNGFAPNPIVSTNPAAFTLTGTNFGPVGSAATVRFVADGGGTPFGNASLSEVTVVGTVASATQITGVAPTVASCSAATTASVVVTLSDGSCVASPAAYVSWTGPTLTSPSAGSPVAVLASAPQASITLTGTGFAPVGGVARVVFVSDAGGPPLFGDGTLFESSAVVGTITSSTTITVRPPHATVCGAASRLASVRVELANGSCAATAAQAVRYDGPTILAIAAVPPGPFLGGTPTPFQISGTGFGPVGSEAVVRFRATSGAPFANGTAAEFDVAGTVTSASTITGTTPLVALCGVASVTASFRVTMQDGSCADSAASAITWTGPTITNVGGVSPFGVPAAVPTVVTINGTGFGPVGSAVDVTFVSDAAGPAIFGDGTLRESSVVQGTIASTTTITVRTPHATVCEATSRLASVRIALPGGACAASSTGAIRFDAPTLTSLAAVPAGPFVGSVATGFQLNGTNLGSVTTTPATVRFLAATGTPFANGTSSFFDVPGVVNAAGTQITGTTPLVAICGVASVTGSIRVTLQDGTCVDSAASFFTFTGPTVTNVNGVVPAVVPSSTPAPITVNGTGFGPVGGFADVVFVSDPAPEPPLFGDGTMRESAPVLGTITSPTTISVTPPNVTVSNSGSRFASVRVRLAGGSCAASAAQIVRFDAPTITSITPTPGPTFDAAIPTSFTLAGAGFGPPGSEALVRFVADSGATPFGNGTLREFAVAGTVNALGTQVTGIAPLVALCPGTSAGASVRVMLQDGTSVQTGPTFLTFVAPSVSSFVPSTFDGAAPSPSTFTVTGAGFGPVGGWVNVRFAATGGARPFGGGTLSDVIVLGQVLSSTTITGTLPLATVCGTGSVTATVTANLPGGACASTTTGAVTMSGPTLSGGTPLVPTTVASTASAGFTLSGAGFGPVGQPAFVTFTALSGSPFGNGTLVETTVTGTIASATSITGFTPLAAVCTGTAQARITVRLPNGSCTPVVGAPVMTFQGPTIASTTPVSVTTPGLTPATFTLNGAGFAPVGPVTVRFLSTDPVFGDGTGFSTDVVGTVVNGTTITLQTPLARVCTASNTAAASVRVLFANGSCADSAGPIVTFLAPLPSSVDGLPPITALNPGPILISGANFPPIGTPVEVVFTSTAGTIFGSGTNREGRSVGFVNPSGFLQVLPPLADVCPPLSEQAATVALNFGSSRCLTPVPGSVTFRAPTFVPLAVSTPANQPAPLTISGQFFSPVGTVVTVGFTDTAPTGTAFDNASQKRTTVTGTVTASNTITVPNPPRPAACPTDVVSTVDVTFANFTCDYPVGGTVTFLAPTITSISDATIETLTPASLVVTGTNFGPTGVQVLVRWQSADLIFADGNQAAIDLPGTVTSNTTIATVAPLARICPNATSTATIRVIFPQGSCADSPNPFVTFPGPTFAANTPSVAALNPGALTVTGANFPPVGTPVTVRLVVTGTPTFPRIFASGTESEAFAYGVVGPANAATVSLPVGSLCPPDATVVVDARVTFASGSCPEATAATITYNAPTITTIGAVTRDATEPATLTINGTNFPPVATQVVVRFTAGAAYPQLFGNAGLTQAVVGTVTAATSITVRPPAAAVCELTTATATLDVNFGNDPCYYAVPGSFTYQGPSITSVTPNTINALTPAALTITGARFGPTVPANTQVTVRWTSDDPIFGDGTLTSVDLPGTIVSSTSITTTAPLARVCAGDTSTATFRLIFPMGACADSGATTVTFVGPSVTTPLAASVNALNPGSVSVTLANPPPVGTPVDVILSAAGGERIFAAGTDGQARVASSVGAGGVVSIPLPIGDLCVPGSSNVVAVGLDIGNSTCPYAAAGTVTYNAPTFTSIGAVAAAAGGPPASLSIAGTNLPVDGSPVTVRFRVAGGATPFADGTQAQAEVAGVVSGGGTTIAVTPPVGTLCDAATAAATLEVVLRSGPCTYAVGGTLTYNRPSGGTLSTATVPALAPTPLTLGTITNAPTLAGTQNVVLRLTQGGGGLVFAGGTAATIDVPGTLAGGTASFTSPEVVVCTGTTTATVSLLYPDGTCLSGGPTLTFTAPTITGPGGSVRGISPGTITLTGANYPPVGTAATVRFTSTTGTPFEGGSSASAEVVGTVTAANTIAVAGPSAVLCGGDLTVDLAVVFEGVDCVYTDASVTYLAPQVAGAGVTGFQPQNLSYQGNTPFTVLATAGNRDFTGRVGQTVDVEFSVAAGTPFRGGTSAFELVPGTVASATTVTGSAPNVVAASNTVPGVNVRVRFEDGTCTDLGTTSYFRADNLLAVSGTAGLTLIATSAANPYGTAANAVVAGTPIAGAAAPPGGVVVLPTVNRAYAVVGATLQIVDLGGPAATAPAGAPTLGAASILGNLTLPAAGTGVVLDPTTLRVFVAAGADVVVVDGKTATVISTVNAAAYGFAGGAVALDVGSRSLIAVGGVNLFRVDADTLLLSGGLVAANVGTAVWTGGIAVNSASGRLFLTYDDPVAANADFVQSLDAADLTTVLWTQALVAGSNPTAVIGVDGTFNRVWWAQAGPNNVASAFMDAGGLAAAAAVPGASAIVGPGAVNDRIYVSSAVNNNVTVVASSTGGVVGAAIAVLGATDLSTTSP